MARRNARMQVFFLPFTRQQQQATTRTNNTTSVRPPRQQQQQQQNQQQQSATRKKKKIPKLCNYVYARLLCGGGASNAEGTQNRSIRDGVFVWTVVKLGIPGGREENVGHTAGNSHEKHSHLNVADTATRTNTQHTLKHTHKTGDIFVGHAKGAIYTYTICTIYYIYKTYRESVFLFFLQIVFYFFTDASQHPTVCR